MATARARGMATVRAKGMARVRIRATWLRPEKVNVYLDKSRLERD